MNFKLITRIANNLQKEMEEWFEERTHKHIKAVQDNAKKIVDRYPEYKELLEIVKNHDASKLIEPERTPYISISWKHKQDNYKGYKTPGQLIDPKENEATLHHVLNNKHHPEAWLKDKSKVNISKDDRDKSDKCIDASLMDNVSIAEMIADWSAMSDELGKNTVREWFNLQKEKRWHFSDEQVKLIDKLIKVFE